MQRKLQKRTNLRSFQKPLKKQYVLKEKAQQEIAHNKEEALNSIKGDVADLTVNLASKLLSQQLDAEGQRQLIDRYLDELGEA